MGTAAADSSATARTAAGDKGCDYDRLRRWSRGCAPNGCVPHADGFRVRDRVLGS
ncbi:hypothetical protein [Streptomyces sp. NPDC093261]|uniref:hypothetical protein n=1 Tax=Streptomyces sp. NPDC093261 TaxID=3366037 RepID=UPI00382FFFAE